MKICIHLLLYLLFLKGECGQYITSQFFKTTVFTRES